MRRKGLDGTIVPIKNTCGVVHIGMMSCDVVMCVYVSVCVYGVDRNNDVNHTKLRWYKTVKMSIMQRNI